ncbi:MAG TPA: hypothetical protein VGR90_10850 [Acidimicrobiales bacterium]|nr:hypothetical protein [Acidimicrobiales bacterium]
MIIVDDKLCLDALAGRLHSPEPVATTWSFHYRLLRALRDGSRWGALSRTATADAHRLAADPPESRLRVLDPRVVTDEAAGLAVRHGLNLLAAELIAEAKHFRAEVHLSAPNVGLRWADVMAAEGVGLTVV